MRTLALAAILVVGGSLLTSTPAPVSAGVQPTCAGQAVTIDLNDPGHADPQRSAADVVLGTRERDSIFTGAGDDVVCGLGEGDTFHLGRGDDEAYGGAGVDTFYFSPGDDLIDGGPRRDWINHWDSPNSLDVDLRSDVAQYTGSGHDVLISIGAVVGSRRAPNVITGTCARDFLSGGNKVDHITGLCGPDILSGGRGDDVLRAGDGDDLVKAGYGRDDVKGGAGDDVLRGATGDDLLDGGAGHDECQGGLGDDMNPRCEEIT